MRTNKGLLSLFIVCFSVHAGAEVSTQEFAREIERTLPPEEAYDYHKRLSENPVHVPRRNPEVKPRTGELALPEQGWKLVWNQHSSVVLQNAVRDFQDYLNTSMKVRVEIENRDLLNDWQGLNKCIVVGTREQLPGCGLTLKGPKDYEITVTPERVTVCGYDEQGAMYGLYNLEARMNLREAPFLPANLNTVRHSLYNTRMVQSWMGWMEFPDRLLAHLAHNGFDGIFASALANPNGDRTTAERSTDFYARILFRIRPQDPARVRDLINRAAGFGIKVYTPIIYQYLGTPESETGLRQLVQNILKEFPDIQGYVLLTEGFWYKQWGGGHGASAEYIQDWARNWSRAVGIVALECHRVNPAIEVLPWEYNIDFRPQNVDTKRYFIQQLPADTIPLLTWENGKSFEMDGLQGYLRDYAISQIGPAEVTQAQIEEARKRGMKVYTNADTFVCGAQLQTVPYHPFPYQWHDRYKALETYGVNGAMESWSTGFTPSFMTELRAWYCWSDAPPIDELLGAIATCNFGTGGKEMVLNAWDLFSQAIRLVPDTGPTMGTSSAIGNPLFFEEPLPRTARFTRSWTDEAAWMGYMGGELNPLWPFTVSRLVFCPDFTNQTNKAELYARAVSGIEPSAEKQILPTFLKSLNLAAERMEEGLRLYRAAALGAPESKRTETLREVIVAEQIERMLLSNHAILEFEDYRLQLATEQDAQKTGAILDRMETIVREEIDRTELSLLAATRDSRLGFQNECDYVYTPFSLREKLKILRDTLDRQLPAHRGKTDIAPVQAEIVPDGFAQEVAGVLPPENLYDYHQRLSEGPVHVPRRNTESKPNPGEFALPEQGWKLIWNTQDSPVLQNAVEDFQDYLSVSMGVQVELEGRDSLQGWQALTHRIVVGTREQLPGCGLTLTGPKDYEITVTPERVTVCGYDERGAMFGLYNLEARMNLREAPFLPATLNTVRHSLYDMRMIESWMGWMEWPDALLAHLVHDGFDGIFASCYANPNGDRSTADNSTEFYARLLFMVRRQDPARMHDLIDRASRFGIKVYTPIIYQSLGTPESEEGLRTLVRDILKEFPDIHGYVLLTEGFWYKQWGGGHGASKEYVQDWARNWCKAVGIVTEECHRVNPTIEILPWEYNIDFRPENVEMKLYFIQQLPDNTIPFLTWENGKRFELDGMKGYLRDYSLNQIGPAEVTEAQIAEARLRNMKVYSKADTFAAWQFGTIPYLPFPYQWYKRYQALEKFGVNGTMESHSSGYTPNFMTEFRAWTCWSDAPSADELLGAIAARIFGFEQKELVLKAWDHFSQAIRLVPDTGPNMGTNNAIGNPLFFQQPSLRTTTFKHSWVDYDKWLGYFGGQVNPYWPFTVERMVFYPDFSNQTNRAELYARSATGVEVTPETKVLPVFLKYLRQASDQMEEGLKPYRAAALASPESKRQQAVREVVVAEQLQRMMQSDAAVLAFEDLRLQHAAEQDAQKAGAILDRMETIAREEIARTERSLLAATRDSRLGFQFEQDYVYTPYSLREKLENLHETLEKQLPEFRKKMSAQ
ncbi:MAG TPA: hypothetical protein PLI09_10980 [Candidatus Hydrogenedentes bacterium]|nr:hypothetical protein [Candidatus Hydrogenedentota bacterium]